jgi:uncharacterized protein YndB with AHSA1/START domain
MKIVLAIVVLLALFLGYVSTRDGRFRYERSGLINAPAAVIFPYLSDFRLGSQWNPFAKKDPNLKATYSGATGQVGSAMDFAGNREAGTGRLELVKVVPGELVQMRLHMTAPMAAENLVEYRLTPEGSGTRFSWAMSGDGGFLGKLVGTFIDCEKMLAGDFDKGIADLKALAEGRAGAAR